MFEYDMAGVIGVVFPGKAGSRGGQNQGVGRPDLRAAREWPESAVSHPRGTVPQSARVGTARAVRFVGESNGHWGAVKIA